jgi:hypothetical protein
VKLPRPYPRTWGGRSRDGAAVVEAWTTVAWLLAVEGRAYLEDIEGGADQPQMRAVVKLRLLELLADLDARLSGSHPPGEDHLLAMAIEYGLDEVIRLEGAQLIECADLRDSLLDEHGTDEGIYVLFQSLFDAFPGELPDPLVPSGQGEILRAMQTWSKLGAELGIDIAYLRGFMEDA